MYSNMHRLILFIFVSCACYAIVHSGEDQVSFEKFNFVNIARDYADQMSRSKNLLGLSGEDRVFVKEIERFLQEPNNPVLINLLQQQSNSSRCVQDLNYVLDSVQKHYWARRMVDAYGKPESGILRGNIKWFGEFDECLDAYAPPVENTDAGNFHGKYCSLEVTLKVQNMSLPLSIGVCLPDSCDSTERLSNFTENLNLTGPALIIAKKIFSAMNMTKLICQNPPKEFSTGAIFVMVLISVFVLLVVIGSSITAYEYFTEPEKDITSNANSSHYPLVNSDVETGSSGWMETSKSFLKCFCAFTNGGKILDTSSVEGQLPCLHGIRFLSMNWVILAHAYGISYPAVRNPLEISKIIDSWIFQVVIRGSYSVDSFFLLSAFLVAYLYFKQAEKTDGKIPWLYFYIHRYIRLTPMYMIILAFYSTMNSHLGSGPLFPAPENNADPNCKVAWWWNILYINNFQPNAVQCFGWPWYLANDMQFYVISPLFLITLWRWPKIGYSLLGLFFCTTFVANFVIIYVYDFNLDMGTILKQDGHIEDFLARWNDHMNKVYVKPYTRIGPYLVGLALGYYLHKRKQNKSGKLKLEWLLAGWLVALGLICACIFSLYHQDLSLLFACFFNALNRTVFAIGLAWILFVCIIGQGGFVDRLLSWKFWFPLSRLTFGAYLLHPIIEMVHFASVKKQFDFEQTTMVMNYIAFLVMSYSAAFLVSLLFESPVIRLERLFRNKFKSS